MSLDSRVQKSAIGAKWGSNISKERPHGPRPEEKKQRPQKVNNDIGHASRSLWIGNLAKQVSETALAELIARFGEIESIHVNSARNYAFINFRKEEDAVIAKRGLQGFLLGGVALKIEFAKRDYHVSTCNFANEYPGRSGDGIGLPSVGDSRAPTSVSEPSLDRHKGDKNAEPNEVLWVGFPSYMKVDEMSLKKEFSPFGEIESVKTFPGRTYAFVRFCSLLSACRAKEALHGKLFNNPRINIYFSKNETGRAEHDRNPRNGILPLPQKMPINSASGTKSTENTKRERNHDITQSKLGTKSSGFVSHSERLLSSSRINCVDTNMMNDIPRSPIVNSYVDIKGISRDSDLNDVNLGDFPRKTAEIERRLFSLDNSIEKPYGVYSDETWKLSADGVGGPQNKRPRFEGNSSSETFKFTSLDEGRDREEFGSSRDSQLNNYSGNLNTISDRSQILEKPSEKLGKFCRGPRNFDSAVACSITPSADRGHGTLEEDWKWQGMIAKGGTVLCRVRCFPVGKILDVTLPEILNCTARTSLDILSKHFYKSRSIGVMFFVPETDTEIIPYKEFMHYLGEKQRVAVVNLHEGTTLFLVPPSNFSEQVLKVPGRVSISGVVLQFMQPSAAYGSSIKISCEQNHLTTCQPFPAQQQASNSVQIHEDNHLKENSSTSRHHSAGPSSIDLYPEGYQSDNVAFSSSLSTAHVSAGAPVCQGHGRGVPPVSSLGERMSPDKTFSAISNITHPQNQLMQRSSSVNPQNPLALSAKGGSIVDDLSSRLLVSQSNVTSMQEDYTLHHQESDGQSAVLESRSSGPIPKFSSQINQNEQNLQTQCPLPPTTTCASQSQSEQLTLLASLLSQTKSMPPLTRPDQMNQQPTIIDSQTSQALCANAQVSSQLPCKVPSSLPVASQFTYGSQINQAASQRSSSFCGVESRQKHDTQLSNATNGEAEVDPEKRLYATLQLAAALLKEIQQQSKAGVQK
eukprot:TRINITY_DN24515_c0_g1_i1.p1 TRINITY_DN24515_c0_g1~~TRINITY_DN24515_c0_g1_i1.p1  ORF type:complete len:973 (-),score=198.03 TRINITY_DN24515_c0_g1_i1:327-3245(-)